MAMNHFKRGLKKAIIFFLVLGAIAVLVITFTTFGGKKLFGRKVTEVIIDSDAGNEMDDLFALARALSAEDLKVTGISSVQWGFHEDAGDSSLRVSQRLIEQLLHLMEKTSVPHPRGADKKLWFFGVPVAKPSEAAQFILTRGREASGRKKLNVVCLGALTNIASAIIIDTTIAENIRLYCLSMNYNPKGKIWNKNEFNAKNDLDALDYCLNRGDLEMHIMPASTASKLKFNYEETYQLMKADTGVWKFLINRWDNKFPNNKEWTMWDVALIEALIDPDFARREQVLAPPENKQRPIGVYTYINSTLMEADYWSSVMREGR